MVYADDLNLFDDSIDMVRACSTNRGAEECIYDIGRKARRKETTRKTNK
jgi:hypothetical protein